MSSSESHDQAADAADARVKAIRDDIWAHDIYLSARRKIIAPIAAFVAVLAALGLYTIFELYKSLKSYAETEAQVTIQRQIDAEVTKLIEANGPIVEQQLKDAVSTIVDKTREDAVATLEAVKQSSEQAILNVAKEAETDINTSRENIDKLMLELDVAKREAEAAAQRLKEIAFAGQQPVARPEQTGVDCEPLALTAEQVDLVGVRQQTAATGRESAAGRPVFTNTFTIDAREPQDAPGRDALTACLLEAIDRVVYGLDPKWFNPAEVVRIDGRDAFRFAVGVWGGTKITASVHFKGKNAPINVSGFFSVLDHIDHFLGEGG